MYPYLDLFGTTVTTYGILVIVGFALGAAVAFVRRRINRVEAVDLVACLIIGAAGALIGAKLFYIVQDMALGFPQYTAMAREAGFTFLQYFNNAGLVYYGGFIGAVLFLLLAAKLIGAPLWSMLDTVVPSIPLMQAFGRVGCLSAGCCYGVPCDWGFFFDASPHAPHGVRLFPVQLIEAACVLGLFVLMVIYGKKPRREGKLLAVYLIGYGVIRFILEFFRYDAIRGIYANLSVSQWTSLAAVALGLFFWFGYPRLAKKKTHPPVVDA